MRMRTARTLLVLTTSLLPVAASAAAAPPPTAAAVHYVVEVPFTPCEGLVCIPVTLDDGKPETFILDTGNVNSYVAADVAQAHGWPLKPVTDAKGKVIAGYHQTKGHVHLGSIALDIDMLAFSHKDMGPGKLPYHGGLVFTDLHDRVLQLDFARHLLRISDVSSGATAKRAGTLKAITFGKHGPPILTGGPFTVNGRSVQAQIDTAYTGTMVVYDQAIPGLGLEAAAKAGVGHGERFPFTDGGVTMLAAKATSIGFASLLLDGPAPTIYFPTPGVHQPDGLFEATVGTAFFRSSVLTLDLHSMTFDVAPAPAVPGRA